MRVALLQVAFDTGCRSGNLQGLCAAVDEAASAEPAPDLLVLPAACDTGGTVPTAATVVAAATSLLESLAARARDWGVYVVVGVHVHRGAGWGAATILIDPDGDRVCEAMATADSSSWVVCPSQIGAIALQGSSSRGAGCASLPPEFDILAIHTVDGGRNDLPPLTDMRKNQDGPLHGAKTVFRAQVSAAGCRGRRPCTGIVGPDGTVHASADPSKAEVLHAKIDVQPIPRSIREKLLAQPGEAD